MQHEKIKRVEKLENITKKIEELLANPTKTEEQKKRLQKLSNKASKLTDRIMESRGELTVYEKYEILEQYHIKQNIGALFEPITAQVAYDIDFTKLRFRKDYRVYPTVSIGTNLTPILDMQFTTKGVMKLLKTNEDMRVAVDENWISFLEYELERAKEHKAARKGGAK